VPGSGRSSEDLWRAAELELQQEKAAVLGRLGRRAEEAIAACEALDASVDHGDDGSIEAYEEARRAAMAAVSDLCLQREIAGLTDQRWVYQMYRVPPSLRRSGSDSP
jgi:hypothetical protein